MSVYYSDKKWATADTKILFVNWEFGLSVPSTEASLPRLDFWTRFHKLHTMKIALSSLLLLSVLAQAATTTVSACLGRAVALCVVDEGWLAFDVWRSDDDENTVHDVRVAFGWTVQIKPIVAGRWPYAHHQQSRLHQLVVFIATLDTVISQNSPYKWM